MNIEAAKKFVKENARPLELAFYNFLFENGSKGAVIDRLAEFQNPDGGFGHGLEADNWNPNSNPIAVNDAIILLNRIDGFSEAEDMVAGIVKYLRSHDSFDGEKKKWLFSIDSNKDYPHAVWWEKKDDSDGIDGFNPTVSLAAFLVAFGGRDGCCEDIIREAFAYLEEKDDMGSDGIKCYLLCYELLIKNNINDIIDLESAKELLKKRIVSSIHPDLQRMGIDYITTPSDYFCGQYAEFVTDEVKVKIVIEKELLTKRQRADGGFNIPWRWYTDYPEEFETAKNMWRPRITLDKVLFYINN